MNMILEKIRSEGSFEKINSDELEKQLDLELKKPSPDYDLVDELTKTILEARGKAVKEIDVKPEIQAIRQKKIKRIRFPKWSVAVSAACAVLIGTNIFSVSAWNMNIFSAVIEFTKGGFSVDFGNNEHEVIELPKTEDDPYGIIAECAKYDIYPETPHYLPEGFVLTLSTHEVNDYSNDINFVYANGKQSITLDFSRYWNDIGRLGIPSDSYNISEITINDSPAVISEEDNQFTLVYQNNKTVLYIFTQDVDYEECKKIVNSIK